MAAKSFAQRELVASASCSSATLRAAPPDVLAAASDCAYAAWRRRASACLDLAESKATRAARCCPSAVVSWPTWPSFFAAVLALMASRLACCAVSVHLAVERVRRRPDFFAQALLLELQKVELFGVERNTRATDWSSSSLACAAIDFFSALIVAASIRNSNARSAAVCVSAAMSRKSSVA